MKQLSKRELVLVYATAVIFAVGILQYGILKPMKEANRIRLEIDAIKGKISAQDAELLTLTQKRMPSATEPQKELMQQYLSENMHFASFVRNITASEQLSDIVVVRLATEGIEKVDGYVKVRYTLFVKAPYLQIGELVEKFESSSLMVEIQSLDLSRDGDDLKRVIGKFDIFNYVVRD